MVTLTLPPEDVTVIVALALLLVSRTDLAVNVTVGLTGTVAGAAYVTVVAVCPESAPQAGAQLLPDWDRAQVTPWLAGSLATDAVNCCVAETLSEALVGEIVTDTGDVTVMVALALLLVSRTDLAVNVTVGLTGTVAGAVYVTVVVVCPESAPHAGAQLLPDWDRAQVTPWLAVSLATDAVNCCVAETLSEALVGEIVTDTGDVTVMVALALLLVSRTDLAVNVTVGLTGTVAGAVYVTVVVVCPESAPHAGAQLLPDWDRAQVTPWLAGSLATDAVNFCVAETLSEALVGKIVTDTGDVTVMVALALLLVSRTDL